MGWQIWLRGAFLSLFLAHASCQRPDASEHCPYEVQNATYCHCSDFQGGHDLWCPDEETPRLRFHYKPYNLWLVCHDLATGDELPLTRDPVAELIFMLRNVNMGGHLDTLEMSHCPLPNESFNVYLEAMNATGLKDLRVKYGESGEDKKLVARQFAGLGDNLLDLKIQSSDITSIDANAFEGLGNLRYLGIVGNRIMQLPGDVFMPLFGLLSLELIESRLADMPEGLLRNQTRLQRLKLSTGRMSKWRHDLLDNTTELGSLHIVKLSKELLAKDEQNEEVEATGIFYSVPNLRNVSVSGRGLGSLPADLFANNKKLERFDWTFNRCPSGQRSCVLQPASFVANITSLAAFNIVRSTRARLRLNEDFFWGCKGLVEVTIVRSGLEHLPHQLFRDTMHLRSVDFSHNAIMAVPDPLFQKTTFLVTLNMANNAIKGVLNSTLLRRTIMLKSLDMSSNNLTAIHGDAFLALSELEHLDLSDNFISFNDTTQPVWRVMNSMRRLDLSHNLIRLHSLPYEWTTLYLRMHTLNISHNLVGPKLDVVPDLNFKQTADIVIDLSFNSIAHVSYYQLEVASARQPPAPSVNLTGNPIECDCRAVDLAKNLRNILGGPVTTWFQLQSSSSDLECTAPPKLQGAKLKGDLDLAQLACVFPSDVYPKVSCPTPCRCQYTPVNGQVLVNCSSLNVLPAFVPLLPNTKIVTLDLSNSQLTNLNTLANTMANYSYVTELILSHNSLKEVKVQDLPQALNSLSIDHNDIKRVDVGMLKLMNGLSSVKLGGNPYDCDCDSAHLYKYVRRNYRVLDQNEVTLQCKQGAVPVLNISDSGVFCSDTSDIVVAYVLPPILLILVLLLLLTLFLFNRETIYIWLYSHPKARALCCAPEEPDSAKPYDVFVSYAHQDEEFVEEVLVPVLEDASQEINFRCLVHVRDFVPGRDISEQIIEAVDLSKRTLIILSDNFVASDWAKMEFDVAHARSNLIVVLKGAMPDKDKMWDGLKEYVRANTYLSWDDPWFWQKLRYALPHKGGSSTWLFDSLFGLRQRRPTDQMNLISANGLMRLNGSATSIPSSSRVNLTSGPVVNANGAVEYEVHPHHGTNSVSPSE